MGVLGDLNRYTQYQAAEALREAANNPGGAAGAGIGVGAGVAMGQMFAQTMNGNQQTVSAPKGGFCSECGAQLNPGAKFCASCGAKQNAAGVCPGCGQPVAPGVKFCPNCGQKL